MKLAETTMEAALAGLRLQPGSEHPGWAVLAGGNHGIDSMLIAPLLSPGPSMLYCFLQSKTSGRNMTVSFASILNELRENLLKNGIQLPGLACSVPGDAPHPDCIWYEDIPEPGGTG